MDESVTCCDVELSVWSSLNSSAIMADVAFDTLEENMLVSEVAVALGEG